MVSGRTLVALAALVMSSPPRGILAGPRPGGPVRARSVRSRMPPAPPGMQEIKRSRGVVVYKDPSSRIIRLAALGRFEATPEQVLHVLLDYEHQPGQVSRVSESRVLQRGDGWLVVYQRLNLPVIDDRDFTLRVTWGKHRGALWVRYRTLLGLGPPPRRGVVRVRQHEGGWNLWPVDGGRATLAQYYVAIDLGGWVPMWMAKASAGNEVPQVFTDFRRMLIADLAAR